MITLPYPQPKTPTIHVADTTSLGVGAPAQLTNMPSGVFGYEGVADPYRTRYGMGAQVYTRTRGVFVVTADTTGDLVAVCLNPGLGALPGSFRVADLAQVVATAPGNFLAQFQFRPADFLGLTGAMLRVVLSVDFGGTATVTLYNLTDAVAVEIGGAGITTISTAAAVPTVVDSVPLTGALNFPLDATKLYQLSAYTSAAPFEVTLGSAELVLT